SILLPFVEILRRDHLNGPIGLTFPSKADKLLGHLNRRTARGRFLWSKRCEGYEALLAARPSIRT
ncbi:MAG: hypothetical protein ACK44Z_01930, partial [Pirellulaceae bacterium]